MIKIDFHVHSVASPDGGVAKNDLVSLLAGHSDRFVAITDHHTTEFARSQKNNFGNKIIVGQEVETKQGDIIGLFLEHDVPEILSAEEAMKHIKKQGGLVYIPHPFDKLQHKSLGESLLAQLAELVDIIEVKNARSITPGAERKARAFAKKHGIAQAAASDGHGVYGLFRGYTEVAKPPTVKNLVGQLENARLVSNGPTIKSLLEPSKNRRKKRAKI